MTPFRKELQLARRAYRSFRYPGDLARQILPARTRWRGLWVIGVVSAGAVAAAAVLGAFLARPMFLPASAQPNPHLPLVREIHVPERMQFTLPSLPSIPGFSRHLSAAPFLPSLTAPANVRVPSLGDLPAMPLSAASESA